MISLKTQNPTLDTIKELSLADLAIMSFTSQQLRKRLAGYFRIDPFTAPDPFSKDDEFSYFLVVDKSNTNRIIAFIVLKDGSGLELWDLLFGQDMLRIDVSKEETMSLKQQLMPKYTNNFYPIRRESSIIGYIAFAFEICGLKD